MTKRAAIYARYSAGPRQTDLSIEGQEKACRKYIEEKGYRRGPVYADRHISGKTDKRPEFQKMIDDARAGLFDVLVVYSLDRFSRDVYDTAIYKRELKLAGVTVESASENIPEGPEGLLMERILEGLAMYYLAELSKKIQRGMTTKAEKGLAVGGPTPFGYKVEDGRYVPDEPKAEAVKEIYQMYSSGSTFTECSRRLRDLGFSSQQGNPFSTTAIKRILSNRKYLGYYTYNGIEIEGGMPKIIDEEIFEMVQEKLKQGKKHRPKGEFALTGKLICGKCGTYMTGTSGTGRNGVRYYYKCKTKDRKNVPRDWIEETVARQIMEIFSDPQELAGLAEKLFALQEEKIATQDEYGPQRAALQESERKIGNIIAHIAENGSSPALTTKLQDLEETRDRLRDEISRAKPFRLSEDEIKAALSKCLDLTIMSPQDLIRAFVHKVVLYDDRILIEFNLTDGEELKTAELLRFDQTDECSTINAFGRTISLYKGRILVKIKIAP